jgi:hypothetical protein
VESIDPSSVAVGYAETELDIYGYFFQAGASPHVGFTLLQNVEYLGPEPVPPHRWRLRATLPTGLAEGIYDVSVVNPDGRSGLLEDGFSVVAGSEPASTPMTITRQTVQKFGELD